MKPAQQWAEQLGIPIEAVRAIQQDAMAWIRLPSLPDNPPPRSPVEFRLSIGAESRERLAHRIEEFAQRAAGNHYDPLSPSSFWGGAGDHGDHVLDEVGITPEEYLANLKAWDERNRDRRRNAEAGA